jgi:hypothetical protein
LWRCITAFTVSGNPALRTSRPTSSFFSCARMPATQSPSSGVESWKLIWTWSRPARARRSIRASSRSTPEVIRLLYSPTLAARSTSASRSLRTVGSPPEKWMCNTPMSAAWSMTASHWSVESSPDARSSSIGFEQYGQCSGQRWVSSASTA